jgi:hypothetical protein
MITFDETANVEYRLSFVDQGKQTFVSRFLFAENGSCHFVSPYIFILKRQHIYSMDIDILIYLLFIYIHIFVSISICIYMYICCRSKQKTEAQAISFNPFTGCSLCKWKFVIFPFATKKQMEVIRLQRD